MKKEMKKAKRYGKKLAHLGKTVAREAKVRIMRDLKDVLENHVMTKKEAQTLASAVLKELKTEADRFVTFVKKEYDRELRKAKPHLKKAAHRLKHGRKKKR